MGNMSSYGGGVSRRVFGPVGILFVVLALAAGCAPDETISPLDPTAALAQMSDTKGWWHWKQTLSIDPDSATISEPGDTVRLFAILSTAWKRQESPTLVEADWFVLEPEVVAIEAPTTSSRSVLLRGLRAGTARIVAIYDGLAAVSHVRVGDGEGEPPDTVPASVVVSDEQPVLLVGDAVTIRPELIDEDSVVIPTEPSEWSSDFDPDFVTVSEEFLITALAPTPPGATTPVVYTHAETGLAADIEIVILPESDPGEWPDNEPPGMTTILMVDGSSKDWPNFYQNDHWADDNRVGVVNDPDSKHGHAIEKRFFVGDESGWKGVTYNGSHIMFRELYFRIVFRLSPNWQWHKGGGKYFYYGAVGREAGRGPVQFVLGWVGSGRTRWIDFGSGVGQWEVNGGPKITRDAYHTIEIHHVASTSGANGSLRMWIDGAEIQSFNLAGDPTQDDVQLINREWIATSGLEDKRLGRGLQGFMYWGGEGDTKQVNDWIRLSEFYVSGRN